MNIDFDALRATVANRLDEFSDAVADLADEAGAAITRASKEFGTWADKTVEFIGEVSDNVRMGAETEDTAPVDDEPVSKSPLDYTPEEKVEYIATVRNNEYFRALKNLWLHSGNAAKLDSAFNRAWDEFGPVEPVENVEPDLSTKRAVLHWAAKKYGDHGARCWLDRGLISDARVLRNSWQNFEAGIIYEGWYSKWVELGKPVDVDKHF